MQVVLGFIQKALLFATRPLSAVLFFAMALAAEPSEDLAKLADKLLDSLPQPAPTVAILPLEGGSESAGIAEYLVAHFAGSGRARLVERQQFHQVLGEQALGQTGALSQEGAVEIGRALAARYLVVGRVADVLGRRSISLRLLDTETAEILTGGSFTVSSQDFQTMNARFLGRESGQVSAVVFRSAVVPGWGQFYTEHPVRGSIFLASFLGSMAYFTYSLLQSSSHADDLQSFRNSSLTQSGDTRLREEFASQSGLVPGSEGFQTAFNSWKSDSEADLRSQRDDSMNQAWLGLGIAGGVYVLNLLDAAWVGSQQKRAFDLYFSATPHATHLQIAHRW